MTLEYHNLNDNFAVAPQINLEDVQTAANVGFKSIIINRPDFEGGAEQPTSADVIAAAKSAGLDIAYQPVISGQISAEDVQEFAALITRLPKPILAYCRSGSRCANLYHEATAD
ncbi:TIGR01244 family sulfur transferase [Paenalcaligenes niemegkensis]|uniref:TIGR01244 family sulfur transferase n=1 Tax=Paenalcaligenes niemegkensis TaxID=2895469 RepID=UPI001EE8AB6B|nr:TIGR01244 family sulfur transferase [Paenalcaligenes niemegkensis]MCQ9617203.1 TIGR01244 family sulfur transferase [Paenalcaligenes niemegkensis]